MHPPLSPKKAVILFSGGLDSTTCLAIAQQEGYQCYTISFSYQQRHHQELQAAQNIARHRGVVEHRVVDLNIGQWGGSALTDAQIEVPDYQGDGHIPVTYVPARNMTFLSIALGYAEVIGAFDLFIGINAVDYSGYPDCRPAFIEAFQTMANLGTRAGAAGHHWCIHTPLLHLSKAQIIQRGLALGVDYGLTVSCYQLNDQLEACGRCDSCVLRHAGFVDAMVDDPTRYRKE